MALAVAPTSSSGFVPLVIYREDRVLPPVATLEFLYTPSRIASMILRWPEIVQLGLNPHTARGLVRPNVETRDAPRLPIKSKHFHGDQLSWADLVADIERAWYALLGEGQDPVGRLRWKVISHRMQGKTLGEIALALRMRKEDAVAAHKAACREMAEGLGYVEPTENELIQPGAQ